MVVCIQPAIIGCSGVIAFFLLAGEEKKSENAEKMEELEVHLLWLKDDACLSTHLCFM
jgi:hypothetical protein